jgi:hypothetical protein
MSDNERGLFGWKNPLTGHRLGRQESVLLRSHHRGTFGNFISPLDGEPSAVNTMLMCIVGEGCRCSDTVHAVHFEVVEPNYIHNEPEAVRIASTLGLVARSNSDRKCCLVEEMNRCRAFATIPDIRFRSLDAS